MTTTPPLPARPAAPSTNCALQPERGFTRYAEGSVLVKAGNTHVLCTASVLEKVPPFLRARARAGSRPNTACCRAPRTRAAIATARGKQSGRTRKSSA